MLFFIFNFPDPHAENFVLVCCSSINTGVNTERVRVTQRRALWLSPFAIFEPQLECFYLRL